MTKKKEVDRWANNTKEQMDLASKGEWCPTCGVVGKVIACVGYNCDGMNMNYAYDCKKCGEQWEGY